MSKSRTLTTPLGHIEVDPVQAGPPADPTYEPFVDDADDGAALFAAEANYQMAESDASGRAKEEVPSPLETTDLADFFGEKGPLAERLPDYELRPSQLDMAEAIKRSLLKQEHAIIEAPTGTGKSIAYLVPALLSGKTVVVATANKSLQSQLYHKDIPFLAEVLGRKINAVVVKGRSNFVCNHKWEQESVEQERFALIDGRVDDETRQLREWLGETQTGDVDELPFLLKGDLRARTVSFTDDCLQRDCRHFEDNCWVNFMRDSAANAEILITNHHLLLNALELGWAGERILPPAAIYIIDEAHGLEPTATAVFETSVTDYTVEGLLKRGTIEEHASAVELDELRVLNTLAFQEVAHLSRDNTFRIERELEQMSGLAHQLEELAAKMKRKNPYAESDQQKPKEQLEAEAEQRRAYELALESLVSAANKLARVATAKFDDSMVRYAQRVFDRRRVTLELHAAPLNPSTLLTQHLFYPEIDEEAEDAVARTVVCTSATLATGGNFAHFKDRCGIAETGEERVLPAVFDYPKQALLYQPPLPAYNWRNADVYYRAAADEIRRLLEVSRGRALCLFTSWSGLQHVSDLLRGDVGSSKSDPEGACIWPLRAQGDAPRDALLAWFKETPHSVLLATRSFWEGVDIPGDDLSLVVLDKMPFPTPGDPLHSARMKLIDDNSDPKASSFGAYMLPLMTLALKQGFGRLIRRSSDSGVVAMLDDRLTSKGYGRQARQDLPPAAFSRDFRDVHQFYRRALDSSVDFALNVSAEAESPFGWRWQLLRLQDGKRDAEEGRAHGVASAAQGEVAGALAGLRNLRERIEKAGRALDQFGVEVRCSEEAAALLLADRAWASEAARWRTVEVVRV